MALKQYREAARTAIIIAREEQNAGEQMIVETNFLHFPFESIFCATFSLCELIGKFFFL